MTTPESAIAQLNWDGIASALDRHGHVVLPALLSATHCDALRKLYLRDELYRSRVVMARHGFGRGEYKYFAYPLPDTIESLRRTLYPHLVPIANRWHEALRVDTRFPGEYDDFLSRCHDAGQSRPTPLILRYGRDDYNCLHRDLYGEHVFPLQLAILLSEPGRDFTGGEFVVTQQAADGQTAEVVHLRQGDAVLFAVNQRPGQGKRGVRRVTMRHGVSRIRQGHRYTVGVIFHDAT